MKESNFKESVIWITGASYGIGEALARELASRGARLALTARGAEKLNSLCESLGPGVDALPFQGDVTSLAEMKSIAARITGSLGPIDMLIANAGTHNPTDPSNFNTQEYLSLMNTNYGGVLNCMEAVLPQMIQRRCGTIVGMSSMAGYRGLPTSAAYGASKAAISVFFEGADAHLRDHGITTAVVYPGFVKTPLTDKNNFHMPFLISSERAALIICDQLASGRRKISFPRPFNWIMEIMRCIPYPIYFFITARVWKRAMRN